jgi:hypothetical protein
LTDLLYGFKRLEIRLKAINYLTTSTKTRYIHISSDVSASDSLNLDPLASDSSVLISLASLASDFFRLLYNRAPDIKGSNLLL